MADTSKKRRSWNVKRSLTWILCGVLGCGALDGIVKASDIERKPIEYSKRQGSNAITELQLRLRDGSVKLDYQPKVGYLPSLLKELKVPVHSQTLVFSKTSLQRNKIAPKTPRALYFNDDIYIGYCRHGDVLEISVADPELGTEFYTLSQDQAKPELVRHTESCLVCHGASATHGLPGHLIRSVYSDDDGTPLLSLGSHRVDTTTPWEKRFGGWYVSGKHGERSHLGNLIVRNAKTPEEIDNAQGQNVTDLSERFDSSPYLSPHSDLVAHLVLTHQAHVHNLIAKASIETQSALYEEKELNRELGEEGRKWESTRRRIRSHASDLVKAIFFCEEAELPADLSGCSEFVNEFPKSGIKDSKGRSLKEIQASGRLMKYPCSYLVYTKSFEQLPKEAKQEVFRQMKSILKSGEYRSEDSPNGYSGSIIEAPQLSVDDRRAIEEILAETLPGWNE